MQDYRSVKPHHPAECATCSRRGAGHRLCQYDGCDEPAEIQYRRHATAGEYAALPESLQPIDGVVYQAVFVCGDHEPDAICGPEHHSEPAAQGVLEVPCPKCGSDPGAACSKPNGKTRSVPHKDRQTDIAPVAASACTHVHREDCGGGGSCACSPDDPAPDRPKRIVAA